MDYLLLSVTPTDNLTSFGEEVPVLPRHVHLPFNYMSVYGLGFRAEGLRFRAEGGGLKEGGREGGREGGDEGREGGDGREGEKEGERGGEGRAGGRRDLGGTREAFDALLEFIEAQALGKVDVELLVKPADLAAQVVLVLPWCRV